MPAREQGQEQRAFQQWNGGRTAAVRRRPSATDPGIRDGPFPQARKATPAAHQGANFMEEAEPPKENVDPKRFSWRECEPLPLPQLREERGAVPSRGDVIEAKIADASGRAVGKVMLEALEVEPAQEAGIFARVACSGVVDPDYAVQVLGMGKERKEFVVHLCAPQSWPSQLFPCAPKITTHLSAASFLALLEPFVLPRFLLVESDQLDSNHHFQQSHHLKKKKSSFTFHKDVRERHGVNIFQLDQGVKIDPVNQPSATLCVRDTCLIIKLQP